MPQAFKDADLEAYLDEGLAPEEMARIEDALRRDPALTRQLAGINARRDAGLHSLGEIWRRHRLSCPGREQLGSYLLGILASAEADAVRSHLEWVGCRLCLANVQDMQTEQRESKAASESRRKKYFQSSAGYLRTRGKKN